MNIKHLREQRGWSQEQLAEMCDLSVRTIQRLERGEAASSESLKSLAAVFEIPLSELQPSNDSDENDHKPVFSQLEQSVLREVRAIRGFHIHFAIYLAVNALLLVINLVTWHSYIWAFWPAFGWGIGIACHALAVYRPFRLHSAEWERREFEKRMSKRQR